MTRLFFATMVSLMLSLCAFAASAAPYAVKGTAIDPDSIPEGYATVKIYSSADTVKPVAMGVTKADGTFNQSLRSPGDYRLLLIAVGKELTSREFNVSATDPVADLGTIIIRNADNLLGEVVVEAQRPLVSIEIDRIGYDVQGDIESKTSMLNETLNKVPLVSVDPDGTIRVKGSTDFKIYKNGRPNNSYSRNAKDIFKSLPASMIQKIEVITEPGAREDAEGVSAILNIITVKNAVTKGVMGNVNTYVGTNNGVPNLNLWMSGQYDKFSFSLYGGSNYSSRHSRKFRSETETEYTQTGNSLLSENSGSGKGMFGYWGLESSLDLSKHHLITFEFGGYLMSSSNDSHGLTRMLDAQGNELYRYSTLSSTDPNNWNDINGSLNYQYTTDREGESIVLSYRMSSNRTSDETETEYTDAINLPMQYTGINSESKEQGSEHTIQIDWTRPINKHNTFDIGGKYIYRDNHSNSTREYIGLNTTHSDFKHITQVGALFADYRLNIGKFGARAGIRYEYSHLAAKFPDGSEDPFSADLNDWVPNAGLIFNPNHRNSFKLSFGLRIQRPGITYLNPAVNTTPNSTSQGNPDLSSVRLNSFSLDYNYMAAKVSASLSAHYIFANNEIISVQSTIGDHTYSGYENAGRRRGASFSGYINWRMTSKTSFMLNGGLSYVHIENPSLRQKNKGWGSNIYGNFSQKLPWKLNFSVYGMCFTSAPGIQSVFRAAGWSSVYYGINLRRSFLKEDRLSVSLSLQNPIHSKNPGYISKSWSDNMMSRNRSYSYNVTNASINIAYRFGSFNTQVKKTNKSISNDDVVGGSSNQSDSGSQGGGN